VGVVYQAGMEMLTSCLNTQYRNETRIHGEWVLTNTSNFTMNEIELFTIDVEIESIRTAFSQKP
jgi:hypothetical protein